MTWLQPAVLVTLLVQAGAVIWWASRINAAVLRQGQDIRALEDEAATVDKRIMETRHLLRNETQVAMLHLADQVSERLTRAGD